VPDEGCTAILQLKDWVAPVTALAILGAQSSFAGKQHTVALEYFQRRPLYQYREMSAWLSRVGSASSSHLPGQYANWIKKMVGTVHGRGFDACINMFHYVRCQRYWMKINGLINRTSSFGYQERYDD